MQTQLDKIIGQSVNDACAAFPVELSRFVLFKAGDKMTIYVTQDVADQLSDNIKELRERLKKEVDYIASRNAIGMAYRPGSVANVDNVRMIGIAQNIGGIFNERFTPEMRTLYVVDHEFGHHVVNRGFVGGHEGECRADAFAVLRHIQRYGMDTDFFTMTVRAISVVLGTSPVHYTDDVFAAVLSHVKTHDISKLDLRETAELADRIVTALKPNSIQLMRLSACFGRAAQAYLERYKSKDQVTQALYKGDPAAYALFCRETAAAMREHADNADVAIAGHRFLNYPPIKNFITQQAQASAEWRDIFLFAQQTPQPAPPVERAPAELWRQWSIR